MVRILLQLRYSDEEIKVKLKEKLFDTGLMSQSVENECNRRYQGLLVQAKGRQSNDEIDREIQTFEQEIQTAQQTVATEQRQTIEGALIQLAKLLIALYKFDRACNSVAVAEEGRNDYVEKLLSCGTDKAIKVAGLKERIEETLKSVKQFEADPRYADSIKEVKNQALITGNKIGDDFIQELIIKELLTQADVDAGYTVGEESVEDLSNKYKENVKRIQELDAADQSEANILEKNKLNMSQEVIRIISLAMQV